MRSKENQNMIFSQFPHASITSSLAGLMIQLFDQQYQSWPLFRKNNDALFNVQTRQIPCNGHTVTLQWNPERITSSTAKVDRQEIAARPCFLCPDNLPEKQRAISYEDTLFILCNPFPIFHHHFTISSVSHAAQEFEPNISLMLRLAEALDSRFTVFYNGPQCGASAPDHFHFQAIPSGMLPIEALAADLSGRKAAITIHSATISLFNTIGCPFFLIQGAEQNTVHNHIITVIKEVRFHLALETEPMINVLAAFHSHQWYVFIFPRAAHRPSLYFAEGSEKKIISPGAIDISGVIITPRQEDFNSLTASQTEGVFKEVSIPMSTLNTIMQRIHTHD